MASIDSHDENNNIKQLIVFGLDITIVTELGKIIESGNLQIDELDNRAIDALKGCEPAEAVQILKEYAKCDLSHISNKSAYLCGCIKAYRQKLLAGYPVGGMSSTTSPSTSQIPTESPTSPDPKKIKEILDRTGYELEITQGQRKYGGPPPDWTGPQPGQGHEVFCGKIPKDIFEDTLIPLFEKYGRLWDLRLMMEPISSTTRGYCFVTYCSKEDAEKAVTELNGYEIAPSRKLKCNISIANTRIFVGNIPKNKDKDEIKEEFAKLSDGLVDAIVYKVADDPKKKNRGFAFLDYDCHKNASAAKRRLSSGKYRVWNCEVVVDWADPLENPDESIMSKVKVLYVSNLTSDVTEDQLRSEFSKFGPIDRAKKVRDYAFIHFQEREQALAAIEGLDGKKIGKNNVSVLLAKPPTESTQKKRLQRKQETEMRERYPHYSLTPPFYGESASMMFSPGVSFTPPYHPSSPQHFSPHQQQMIRSGGAPPPRGFGSGGYGPPLPPATGGGGRGSIPTGRPSYYGAGPIGSPFSPQHHFGGGPMQGPHPLVSPSSSHQSFRGGQSGPPHHLVPSHHQRVPGGSSYYSGGGGPPTTSPYSGGEGGGPRGGFIPPPHPGAGMRDYGWDYDYAYTDYPQHSHRNGSSSLLYGQSPGDPYSDDYYGGPGSSSDVGHHSFDDSFGSPYGPSGGPTPLGSARSSGPGLPPSIPGSGPPHHSGVAGLQHHSMSGPSFGGGGGGHQMTPGMTAGSRPLILQHHPHQGLFKYE